jgi:hypothetical protein
MHDVLLRILLILLECPKNVVKAAPAGTLDVVGEISRAGKGARSRPMSVVNPVLHCRLTIQTFLINNLIARHLLCVFA